MKLLNTLLEQPLIYRLWQAPFAERKFLPIREHNDLTAAGTVLDVGCGPGTNAHHFPDVPYTGIDLNDKYVRAARARHNKQFVTADVTGYLLPLRSFDFILVNSLLHHLNDVEVRRLLASLASALSSKGHVHILELEMPPHTSPARVLAKLDRGKYARSLEQWRRLFAEYFSEVLCVRYPLGFRGLALWRMLYFKGRVVNP